jgi:hypothetical protein
VRQPLFEQYIIGNRRTPTHNFPIIVSKSKERVALWTKIDDFNEMLFARLVTLVVSIACAHYGAHPESSTSTPPAHARRRSAARRTRAPRILVEDATRGRRAAPRHRWA